ncbi:MAG: branched-chain amino acid ABC transporter permease, partial [Ilumatobacteraceae bacterium]
MAEALDTPTTATGDAVEVDTTIATRRQLITAVVFVAAVLVFVPIIFGSFWLQVMTSVVIYSIVTLALGVLVGRTGMVSLSQFVLIAIGAWVALRLDYATSLPFPVLLLIGGVITGVIGTAVGLPALRLSGLHLALITLMAAGGFTLVIRQINFPNGGSGFWGNSASGGATSVLDRPVIAEGDVAYFRYALVVTVLMFALVIWHTTGKPGRAWAALRQSQVTAAAAGVNTTFYRLWAFALASFMTGIAGGLLAGAAGGVAIPQFQVVNNVTLLAVVLMGGVYRIWGAVVGAALLRLLPALLDDWGVPTEVLQILFGIGVIQVLLTAPGGLVEQFPKDMANLGRLILR